MIAYIDGVCDKRITDIKIQSIVFPKEPGYVEAKWDDQEIDLEDGIFTARLKEVYFIDVYMKNIEELLKNSSVKVNFSYRMDIKQNTDYHEFLNAVKCVEVLFVDGNQKYEVEVE